MFVCINDGRMETGHIVSRGELIIIDKISPLFELIN